MYFATTIAERRITGKENTLSWRQEKLPREKKKRRKEDIYRKKWETGQFVP